MDSNHFNIFDTNVIDNKDVLEELLTSTPQPPGLSVLQSSEGSKVKQPTEMIKRECLSSKNAVKFLLDGTLKKKVCRYCLNVTSPLSELDQVLQVAGQGVLYKVTIREMIASFHSCKVVDDPNIPNKICNKCLDHTLTSYLFNQQCERSERALRNCFEDMYDKFEKLDPLERTKKRGRQKLNLNHNVLYADHENVIDYAEPLITIVNTSTEPIAQKSDNQDSQGCICSKCCQELPNLESLLNHEKSHPKSMLYHCHLCGKSFVKRFHLKKHIQSAHSPSKQLDTQKTDFKCQDCGTVTPDYQAHLQHIEKHKFKTVLDHLMTRKMDKLCAICLNSGSKLADLEKIVCLHGGYPELMGERSLYSIVGSTVPAMNMLHNYTGTKICEKCLNHAIISYVFIQQTLYIRQRFTTCISDMLENLNKIDHLQSNLFIEISEQIILPLKEELFDEHLMIDDMNEVDESTVKVDVLEDEFRIESDSDSDFEKKDVELFIANENLLNKTIKTYERKKTLNGVCSVKETKYNSLDELCSEFLTFKKRNPKKILRNYKYTCPLCNKHFISDYFLRRHILKHALIKCKCHICGLTLNTKFHLYEHKRIRHILEQHTNVSCRVCGRAFTSHTKLYNHEKCHKNKQCQLCDKIFVSQEHYNIHMTRHVPKLKVLKQRGVLTCSFCEKECANDNDLSVHVNRVHLQIKPYSCDMCDKQFYTESNMSHHKKAHSLPTKETCEFCKKTLKSRMALVTHVRKHIGVRPHCCQVCEQAFHSLNKLKTHMRIYHGGRFCCKLCRTVFSNKTGLKDHMNRVHSII